MKEKEEPRVRVLGTEDRPPRDDMALRKVARAVLAIAARQLREEPAMSEETDTDAEDEQ